jgi:hypothetical protein
VLLVGGSSVGKTRCAVEAVNELLPEWWLVHPAGPGEVAALAQAPFPRMVVWLDELQRYLDGEHGLTGAVVRALLNAPHPAVIIGTLWPDRYTAYTTVPVPGGADPHAREREVLDMAAVVRIDSAFSPTEQDRARAAAGRDPRLRVALGAAGYGLTQTLAAAPQLVARWEDARTADRYAWAVLTAALDVTRLGARAPLSTDFLRAAAPGYWTSQQQAEAPENWFDQALVYATGKLHGAAAALSPAGAGIGQVAGYTAADFLIQHASRERRSARVPASTWDAILGHLRDPPTPPGSLTAPEVGCCTAAPSFCTVTPPTPATGRPPGSWPTCWPGAATWTGCAPGPTPATGLPAVGLADLLAERGDLDEAAQILRARADAGDEHAARRLADLLAERGDLDEAAQILRARADAGDRGRIRLERADRPDGDQLGRISQLGHRAGPAPDHRQGRPAQMAHPPQPVPVQLSRKLRIRGDTGSIRRYRHARLRPLAAAGASPQPSWPRLRRRQCCHRCVTRVGR